jgi:DNA-binding response OmpR family regulator
MTEEPTMSPPTTDPKPCVVVAEDDDDLRALLLRGLGRRYWKVVAVATFGELVPAIEAASPDVVVLDWGMPDGDGTEMCVAIKAAEATRHLPVVILTGAVGPVAAASVARARADAYVTKPFSVDDLDALLHRLVAAGRV